MEQVIIEGFKDLQYEAAFRKAEKARAEAEDAKERKKHASMVAGVKEEKAVYCSILAKNEEARVQSIEIPEEIWISYNSGAGITVGILDNWVKMSGLEKSESAIYSAYSGGIKLDEAELSAEIEKRDQDGQEAVHINGDLS
ncbi:MAG: hypothetical protein VB083_02775 [Aminobacterium sp.]|nr:hypothetical protein [Aminobacterium sp.]MEA4876811.1 hypothetical protein [Aminobacterium sp.]